MTTIEESVRLLIEGLAETNRRFEVANGRFEAANERFAFEMIDFKEENRIGWEKVRQSQLKSEEENRIGFEELRKSHKKTESFFNMQWGKLVEALVNNQVVPLLQERNIPVDHTNQRVKGRTNGQNFEFDIIAENGDAIVVIEVKTTLRVDDVSYFLEKLNNFRTWLPRYAGMKVYGAVAFLHETSEAALYAERSGLFSILATGSSAAITNPLEFEPRMF